MHPYRPRSVRYAVANLAVAISATFGIALLVFSDVIGPSRARTAAIGAALLVAVPIFAWRPSRTRAALAAVAGVAAAATAAVIVNI